MVKENFSNVSCILSLPPSSSSACLLPYLIVHFAVCHHCVVLKSVLPEAWDQAEFNHHRVCEIRIRAIAVSLRGVKLTSKWSSIAKLEMPLIQPPEKLRALAHGVDQIHMEWSVAKSISCEVTEYRLKLISSRMEQGTEAVPSLEDATEGDEVSVPVVPEQQPPFKLSNGLTIAAVHPKMSVYLPVSRTQLSSGKDPVQIAVHWLRVCAVALIADTSNVRSIQSEWSHACDSVTMPFLGWSSEDASDGSGPPADASLSKAIAVVDMRSVKIDLQACKEVLRCVEVVPEKCVCLHSRSSLSTPLPPLSLHLFLCASVFLLTLDLSSHSQLTSSSRRKAIWIQMRRSRAMQSIRRGTSY